VVKGGRHTNFEWLMYQVSGVSYLSPMAFVPRDMGVWVVSNICLRDVGRGKGATEDFSGESFDDMATFRDRAGALLDGIQLYKGF